MANPLDDVTQNRRDDSGNPLRRVYIDTSDAPVAQGAGAGNALMQSMQPAAAEAVPWTIEDLQRGVEAIKQYVAGNVAPVNDMAKRFTNYDRQFTQDVINAPTTIWGNPTAADKVGQRFMGGENWLSNMVRSATTSPGKALASETPVTSEQMIAPAQDIAGMATGSMLFGKPGAATLGAGPVRPAMKPSLVPAIKFEGRVYRAEPGVNHLDMVPPKLQKFMDKNGIEDLHDIPENTPGFGIGFVNHKGHFLSREGEAAKYAAQYPELIIPEARDIVKQGAMSSDFLMFSDSQPGTAVSALAQSAKGPAPVFYSALEHAATNAAQETMNPQQWLGFLKNTPGVKAEELAWTGLPEWLGAQKGKVSKKDVQSYLDEHKVEIKDVTKTGPKAYEDLTPAELERVKEDYRETNGMEHDEPVIWDDVRNHYDEMLEEGGSSGDVATKYSSYQLPGGENYREHLLTMPAKNKNADARAKQIVARMDEISDQYSKVRDPAELDKLSNEYADLTAEKNRFRAGPAQQYNSSHWDEPNVLAHIRTNDRTMARELSPEHVAVNEARAKVQQQIEAVKHEQAAVANEISAVVRPLEKARQAQIRADIKANRVSGAEGLKKLDEYYEHPEIKPLQDKLEQLRAKETELGYSIHDIVPKTMTDEQALAAAKDWVNESNPNSKKWEQTPKVRQDAWLEQVQKVAGRKAMNEAEKPVKSLHIEEIQSDWHQQGRKQGYKKEFGPSDVKERKGPAGDTQYYVETPGAYNGRERTLNWDTPEDALNDARHGASSMQSVPDAPFKTTWPELALKRMIRKAAEEGYDRISWTPGEAQAARYDLSKSIDKIYYNPDKNILIAYDKNSGRPAIEKHDIKPGQLADVIGKEAADKIINNPSSKEKGNHVLSNADLKVGGEGMREFYDKMLPKMVEKIGKTHGVRVKQIKLPSDNIRKTVDDRYTVVGDKRTFDTMAEAQEAAGQPVHYFDLPQSLKEHAIGKGFPLYMSGVPFPLTPVDYDPFAKKEN